MRELLEMFWAFFCIGGLTFGGGYSMLPMLTRYCVDKHHWTTEQELLDYFAMGQCIPGIIAVNTAAFIGYQRRKFPGVLAAALGVVTPSILVITVIAMALEQVMHYPMVGYAFSGIRIAVGALIMATVLKLLKSSVRSLAQILLCAAALAASLIKTSPVIIVLAAALVGVVLGRRVDALRIDALLKKGDQES